MRCLILASIALLPSCANAPEGGPTGTGSPTTSPVPTSTSTGAAAPSERQLRAFAQYHPFLLADYERADTVADLAARADVVVEGTIDGVEPGQSYASTPNGEPEYVTSVLSVLVDDVLGGSSTLVMDDHVYIEIPHRAFGYVDPQDEEGGGATRVPFDRAAFAETVPVGARGISFLGDRTNEGILDHIIDEGAGRPSGAPVTQAHFQGFLVWASGDQLVSVFADLDTMPRAWRDLDSLEDVRAALSG